MSGVVALQRAAAVWESSHDRLIVAEDLQAGQEQRLTLASRHHHLGRQKCITEASKQSEENEQISLNLMLRMKNNSINQKCLAMLSKGSIHNSYLDVLNMTEELAEYKKHFLAGNCLHHLLLHLWLSLQQWRAAGLRRAVLRQFRTFDSGA